jgi:hypothetical protein
VAGPESEQCIEAAMARTTDRNHLPTFQHRDSITEAFRFLIYVVLVVAVMVAIVFLVRAVT